MPNIIQVKIDMNKVDKSRFFNGRNGALYLDLVLLPVRESKYGETHMVKQSVTKDERAAKVQLPILGNAKEMGGAPTNEPAPRYAPPAPAPYRPSENLDEDVPF